MRRKEFDTKLDSLDEAVTEIFGIDAQLSQVWSRVLFEISFSLRWLKRIDLRRVRFIDG